MVLLRVDQGRDTAADDVVGERLEHRREVTALPRLERLARDLHVLPRHAAPSIATTAGVTAPPFDELLAVTPAIRYVAFAAGQEVSMRTREDLASASAEESDRYEELLVNPTLLKLARQRGEIDCGGLRFLIVSYGNFHQLVLPLETGHVSIAFELESDPLEHLEAVRDVLDAGGLL
jgi:hypothetical protein